jgi:hypothetical protein
MTALITRIYLFIVAWFRPREATSIEPIPAPPTLPPTGGVEPITPTPQRRPRGKWVKPKGGEQLKREPRATPPRKSAIGKNPRPVAHASDDDPEQWGQFYFRDTILDQLDVYFQYLRRIKQHDPDAYDLHRQLGIQIMPVSAIRTFDKWRTEQQEQELSAWWSANRPTFGAVAYGVDKTADDLGTIGIADLPEEKDYPPGDAAERIMEAGRNRLLTITAAAPRQYDGKPLLVGTIWTPRFLYFHKYAKPPPDIEQTHGDVYTMTVYWDRTDSKNLPKSLNRQVARGGVPQSYAVVVDKDGHVRVLRMLLRDQITIRGKYGRGRGQTFTIPNTHWAVPDKYLYWAKGHLRRSPEEILRGLFIEAALMYESGAMGSMIRVAVAKNDLTATFGVEIKRTPYFFKDRDVTLNGSGGKQRIFHIVRPHQRSTGGGLRNVRMHFRGLKNFMWADYSVAITVPGRDHFALPEFNVGISTVDDLKPGEKGIGMAAMGKKFSKWIADGVGGRR